MRPIPDGHSRLSRPGTTVVVRDELVEPVRAAMAGGTLYDWAASHPERTLLTGRLPVYAAPLPHVGHRVVVRRNARGGLLASWRRDRFIRSRAPRELENALILAALGVPTPPVLAYAHYRVNAVERCADVVTVQLPPGLDFGAALLAGGAPEEQQARWHAVSALLRMLAEQGVWHQDLNVKNIYLCQQAANSGQRTGQDVGAYLLDVDRVKFVDPGRVVARVNSARLLRSLRKLEIARGSRLTAAELTMLDIAKDMS